MNDGVGQTIVCTKHCRCQKTKSIVLYTINPLLYKKRSLCVFEPLVGDLGATHAVHLSLIGKPVVDFLLMIIELFSATSCYGSGATSEYRLKVAVFEGGGRVTQRNFAADFHREKYTFEEKWSECVFEPSLGGVGATYAVHLRLIGKLVVKFLLVVHCLIDLFC